MEGQKDDEAIGGREGESTMPSDVVQLLVMQTMSLGPLGAFTRSLEQPPKKCTTM